MRLISALLLPLALAACVSPPPTSVPQAPPPRPPAQTQPVPPSQPAPPPVAGFRQPQIMQGPGLDGVIRREAGNLVRQFGDPRLDVSEGDMRKLQFSGEACVMDIYLYPLQPGAEPVATWIETRRASDGAEVDRLACMQALRRG
ncbi:hypothetical protein [Alteraurantiacibacter aquimixticola]|uniref:Lipoprotein n=1 Tax=Alteraurantiacibacter aquimixticola TaxID=2489173 RepID=A0A4T3F388_9SPHN|nr:hypothetical protein [Alteraurantiacibacter aquimixticola]TIX49100.1 hypothetical protein E5222_15365 [Alteraurantiacibacter aquimixticola]